MGSLIDAKVIGLHRIERLISGLGAIGGMARYGLLRQLGELIRAQHTRRVLSEKTSPSGAAWAGLKPSTVKRKGNGNILVETGVIARSWQLFVGADNVRMRNTARSRKGRAVLYLPFHQFGTKYMVQREVMGFSQQNLAEIQKVVNSWVAAKIGMAA
jgi:phage gpG-like protein